MPNDRLINDRRAILVVEDCDDDFDTVVEAAAQAQVSHRLVRAVDAEAAQSLLGPDAASLYAFILLDYKLPGMDGLAWLDIVRRDPALAALPIVVLTTSIHPDDLDAFCLTGAAAVHLKSVQHSECLRTLVGIFAHWLNRVPPRPAQPAT